LSGPNIPEDTLLGAFNGEEERDLSGPDEKILVITRLATDLRALSAEDKTIVWRGPGIKV